ncbi:uncharacterized protein LOC125244575 [Megalobrama amblycephala]|uniref:uncharacterized protein LOC125244575 n=1 Tax=Megalobrama amblycephala TaxID=75352 RepID=UPI0020143AF1|nr:uncharacterized protein LOC125244575 [Megalobrama amblycephala]XP_048010626.1 uncharacterized protein LOC125244575 [Megalobrama amblycephala]
MASVSDVSLPLCAGEDTFELHAVQLELEAMERQIRTLLEKQAKLRERQTALETSSCADAHQSSVSLQCDINTPASSTPCVSLHRARAPRTSSSQPSFTPVPSHQGPWVLQQRKTRARPRTRTSPPPPPPVFGVSTRNRFSPLREAEHDAMVLENSIVLHVHATKTKGKERSHRFPGARVLDVATQVPAILNGAENMGAVVLHAGVNDTRLRQTEVLKQDFRSQIETVKATSPATKIIMSGPLPTYRRGHERLFRADGLHPRRIGGDLLSENISKTLCTA